MIVDIKNAIIPNLSTFLGCPVIEQDQIGTRPTGSYITYKLTIIDGKDNGQADEFALSSDANSVTLKNIQTKKLTLSINAYAVDADDCMELAIKAKDYFLFDGYDVFEDNGIAIVQVTDIQNRDSFLVEDYQRRNGFDCIIRVTKEATRLTDYINQVNVNQ